MYGNKNLRLVASRRVWYSCENARYDFWTHTQISSQIEKYYLVDEKNLNYAVALEIAAARIGIKQLVAAQRIARRSSYISLIGY